MGGTIRQTGRMIGHPHHVGLATIPSSLLRIGSVRHLDSLCRRDHDRTTGETVCCIEEVTAKDKDQNADLFFKYEISWSSPCCPLLRYATTQPFHRLRHPCESTAVTSSKIRSTIIIQKKSLSATRPFVSSWLPVADQCLWSNAFIAYLLQRRPWMVSPTG